jgi:hypothetical protein
MMTNGIFGRKGSSMRKEGLLIWVVVIALLTLSCDAYKKGYEDATLKSNEALLRQTLKAMRGAIDQYAIDHGALPQSIDDIVGYINLIPEDPITEKKDWKVVIGERKDLRKPKGIVDVRSSSTLKSSEGTLYSEW